MNDATRRVAEGWGFDNLDEILESLGEDVEIDTLSFLLLIDIDKRLYELHGKVDKVMTDLSGLEAAVQKISEVDQTAAQALASLRDEVAALKAGEISQEQIDSLANNLNTASTALAESVSPAAPPSEQPPAEEPPAEQPAEPSPEGGTETPPAE